MNLKEKIISVIPIVLIVIFFYIITSYISGSYEKKIIQDNLMWITPIFFGIILALIIISLFLSFKHIKKMFIFDKKVWIALLIIFLVGFSLRTFATPQTHRLYFDEDIYVNIAQNIKNEGRTILCNYGTQEKCTQGIYNKQPNGYPFLISILFFVSGVNEVTASHFTIFLSSLTIILIFLITYLFFENEKIGLFSALLFALVPINIMWATTTSAGSTFVLFTALAFLGFLSYFKNNKKMLLIFSLASLAYAIQIRPEGTLLIPLVALMFILFDKNLLKNLGDKKFLALLVIFSALIVPHLLHLNSVSSESWGSSGSMLGTEYFNINLKDNGWFFFENTRLPVVFTLLSLIGLYPFRKYWKRKTFLTIWFLVFFGLYLLFYAGSFNYGVDVRFSLNLYLPFVILGACGSFLIAEKLKKIIKNNLISLAVPFIIIMVAFMQFIPIMGAPIERAWDARAAHDFAVETLESLDDDCWIFTHVPSVIQINGKNSLQAWYGQNPKIVNKLFKESDCIMFYEEYWCSSDPYKSGPCKYFHDNFDLTVYDSLSERHKNFTFYVMKQK